MVPEYDWIPLTEFLQQQLLSLKGDTVCDWVFPDPSTREPYVAQAKWLASLCRDAGVKAFGFHGIRHLTASILVKGDAPLIGIITILRHKSISTTERYIHRLKSVLSFLRVSEGGRLTQKETAC